MSISVTPGRRASGRLSAADRAYARRERRDRRLATGAGPAASLQRVGMPVREVLAKIPFVIVMLVVLAAGGVGVLYLNTRTDEMGIRATQASEESDQLKLRMESLQRDIAHLDSTPEIARRAVELGLVPAKGGNIVVIGADGKVRFVNGTPATEPTGGH